MDLLTIAKLIYGRVQELERLKADLSHLAESKASTAALYDKNLAMTIVGLKNGKEYELETVKIAEQPTTIIEKVAKGIIWKDKLAMDSAESAYKNAFKIIELTQAQLNGYQSINRYLSEVSNEKTN